MNDLQSRIKADEARMSENAVLQKQIINYVKTRDVYAAYRKAGYSKKFYNEHESEIIIHKAAKKAFDDLGLKKLPTVKSLKAEYAEMLAEKKSLYSDYYKLKNEQRDLLIYKANIERIMQLDEKKRSVPDSTSRKKNKAIYLQRGLALLRAPVIFISWA